MDTTTNTLELPAAVTVHTPKKLLLRLEIEVQPDELNLLAKVMAMAMGARLKNAVNHDSTPLAKLGYAMVMLVKRLEKK